MLAPWTSPVHTFGGGCGCGDHGGKNKEGQGENGCGDGERGNGECRGGKKHLGGHYAAKLPLKRSHCWPWGLAAGRQVS